MIQIESFFLYTKNQLTKKLLYNKNSLINNDNRNTFVKLKKAPKGQKKRNWQRAIFAQCTIVAAMMLNFCVRYGYRCVHHAIATRSFSVSRTLKTGQ